MQKTKPRMGVMQFFLTLLFGIPLTLIRILTIVSFRKIMIKQRNSLADFVKANKSQLLAMKQSYAMHNQHRIAGERGVGCSKCGKPCGHEAKKRKKQDNGYVA